MGNLEGRCYDCGKNCVNVEFCNDGGALHLGNAETISASSLPRMLKVKVTANPEYWGFGGTLIEGEAYFQNGYYDFFDGLDEDKLKSRTCDSLVTEPYRNEERPDIFHRSVYDPDDSSSGPDGRKHYDSAGNLDSTHFNPGGAESYLIDRPKNTLPGTLSTPVTADEESCDKTIPTKVFKKFPDNYGFGNKISFYNKFYKNITGAWRFVETDGCGSDYAVSRDSTIFNPHSTETPSGEVATSGKMEIRHGSSYYLQRNDPSQIRAKVPGSPDDCLPDGARAGNYTGAILDNGIYRDTSTSNFIKAKLSYNSVGANGIKTGMTLGFAYTSGNTYDGAYTVLSATHNSAYTDVELVGTYGTGNFTFNPNTPEATGKWVAFNTFDPMTCCTQSALGVNNDLKQLTNETPYHIDFGRIFNNPKTKRQSGRLLANRKNHDVTNISAVVASGHRRDAKYPFVTDSGTVLLSSTAFDDPHLSSSESDGFPLLGKEMPYYGAFYDIDRYDLATRLDNYVNTIRQSNATCYQKKGTLEVYPDCFNQYERYRPCDESIDKFSQNTTSRLAFVYRGCDFNDPCSFDVSGRPMGGWSAGAPQNLEDLKRGLAGQEVYMYLNLDSVWGAKIVDPPCSCFADPPPGQQPPIMVNVQSPITFKCFPKFDLDPSGYGCNDARYQASKYYEIYDDSGVFGPGGVLDCTMAGDSPGRCDPFPTIPEACNIRQPYTTYGFMRNLCGKETDNKREVIVNAFSTTTQAGSGEYRNTIPNGGTNVPMHWEFNNPGSLIAAVTGSWNHPLEPGRFSEGGDYGFWGLADEDSRLISPYFLAETGSISICNAPYDYVKHDTTGTFFNGWPTTAVPFLIEIDHEDTCTDCITTQMPTGNLTLTLSGLDGSYLHDNKLIVTDPYGKYGYSHCGHGGPVKLEPPFTCESGFPDNFCPVVSGWEDGSYPKYSHIKTDSTCPEPTQDITLSRKVLRDSNIGIGYMSGNCTNSFVKLEGWGLEESSFLWNGAGGDRNAQNIPFDVYGSFILHCPTINPLNIPEPIMPSVACDGSNVHALWSCPGGGNCAHSYPSDNDLQLSSRFAIVAKGFNSLFESTPDQYILGENAAFPDVFGSEGDGSGWFNRLPPPCCGKVLKYGCALEDSFYGAGVDCSGCPPFGLDPVNGCPSCSGVTGLNKDGETVNIVDCRCDKVIASMGIQTDTITPDYNLPCYCDCSQGLAEIWNVACTGDGELSLAQNLAPGDCLSDIFWISYSGNGSPYNACGDGGAPGGIFRLPGTLNYGEREVAEPTYYIRVTSAPTVESKCAWHSGPNAMVSGISYQLFEPGRDPDKCNILAPDHCEQNEDCDVDNNAHAINCGDPIYSSGNFDTQYPDGVTVRRKSCYPEIAIVSKIDCFTENDERKYKLHISREYYNHDRSWSSGALCTSIGGAYNSTNIPYATPSDSVTPAYPTGTSCSVNPPSGTHVTQDFQFNGGLWNYFNLFYTNGFPSASYTSLHPDKYTLWSGFYNTPPGKFGTDYSNKQHSCIQDSIDCGGLLWCNKMFFPRRPYASGTKMTAFGGLSVCTQSSQELMPTYYGGYLSSEFSGDIDETQLSRFVDPCNNDHVVTMKAALGIDEVEVIVDDYLPLMGVTHPGWKHTIDVKSCTVLGTGCADGTPLPTHTDRSIEMGTFAPKSYAGGDSTSSYGYYLDKVATSGDSNCLLSPFKIYMDVECCSDRVRREGFSGDPPTKLEYVISNVPGEYCGMVDKDPACGCEDTDCNSTIFREYICQDVYELDRAYELDTNFVAYTGVDGEICIDCDCIGCEPSGTITVLNDLGEVGASPGAPNSRFIVNTTPTGVADLYGVVPECDPPDDCCDCPTFDDPSVHFPTGVSVVQDCREGSGAIVYSYFNKSAAAYNCGDTTYMTNLGDGTFAGDCCTIDDEPTPLCEVLLDPWQYPTGTCFVGTETNTTPHSGSDYLDLIFADCECTPNVLPHSACTSESVLSAIITES